MKTFITLSLVFLASSVQLIAGEPIDGIAYQPPVESQNLPPSPMALSMKFVGKAVEDPEYYVWCTSPLQAKDGKIHLFCSRWPKSFKMRGWVSDSEIAHYIGDSPEGPFEFSDVALAANPGADWNNTIHNPAIFEFDGQFVLLYITFDRRQDSPWASKKRVKMYTCMATAPSLSGPWTLQGEQGRIIQPSTDPKHWTYNSWSLDNPTMLTKDGKFYIYFKAGPKQGTSQYACAVADKVTGPYRILDTPATNNISYIEDATCFIWNGKCNLLTTDNYGKHTGSPGRGILWQSDDPTQYKRSEAKIGFLNTDRYTPNLDLSKASHLRGHHFKFERPGVLMLDGKPAYFYGATGMNLEGGDHTVSYVMKIDLENPDSSLIPKPPLTAFRPACASSTWTHRPGFDAKAAFDNDNRTRWSATEKQAWLAVDIKQEQSVRGSNIHAFNKKDISSYEIQVRRSKDQWETVHVGQQIQSGKDILFSKEVLGREFRLKIIESRANPTISEFTLLASEIKK